MAGFALQRGMVGKKLGRGLKLPLSKGGGGLVTPPSGFLDTWDMLGMAVTRVGSGEASTFTTNYDFPARRTAWEAANAGFLTLYVDLAGSNNNDGLTPATAFRSLELAVAYAQADATTAFKIIAKSGTKASPAQYKRSNTQARSGQPTLNATYGDCWYATAITKPFMIVPDVVGGRIENLINSTTATFTATADANVWLSSLISTQPLIDLNNRTRHGAGRTLVPLYLGAPADAAAAIAALNAAWTVLQTTDSGDGTTHAEGVYWRDTVNNLTYVRLFDSRNPTTAFGNGSLARVSTGTNVITFAGAQTVAVEGVNFIGGPISGTSITVNAATGFRPRLDWSDCTFVAGQGSSANGAVVGSGASSTTGCDMVFLRCEASGALLDGFNWHQKQRIVEIDCDAYWNGREAVENLANNSSTAHEDTRILRVGGRYLYAQDRSIQDINLSKAWMLGSTVGSRRTNATTAGGAAGDTSAAIVSGHPSDGLATVMWLDACRTKDSPFGASRYTLAAYPGATLNVANMGALPTNPYAGTIQAYTP